MPRTEIEAPRGGGKGRHPGICCDGSGERGTPLPQEFESFLNIKKRRQKRAVQKLEEMLQPKPTLIGGTKNFAAVYIALRQLAYRIAAMASSKRAPAKDFAARLIAWRKHMGLSQQTGAAELGVNNRTLHNWEQRRRRPLLETAEPILKRLEKDGF